MACEVCKKTSDQVEIFGCDGCEARLCKLELSSMISASEIKVLQLRGGRYLKFYCAKCKNGDSFDLFQTAIMEQRKTMDAKDKIIALLEEKNRDLLNKVNKLEGQLLDGAVMNVPTGKLFAEVVKRKAPEAVLLVKPKNDQNSRQTKKDIRLKIDPVDINVSKFREVKNGGVVIGCADRKDIDTLRNRLVGQLGPKYTVESPALKRPKLKIFNINNEDISMDDSDDVIIDLIVKWNELNTGEGLHMKVLKKTVNRFKNIDMILELDSRSHSLLLKQGRVKLGWSRCRVFNHVSVLQCYNCMGFHHFAKDCKSNTTCSNCSGNHTYKDCNSNIVKCTNCVKAKKDKNLDIDVGHNALNRDCPSLLRLIGEQSKRIDYFSEAA